MQAPPYRGSMGSEDEETSSSLSKCMGMCSPEGRKWIHHCWQGRINRQTRFLIRYIYIDREGREKKDKSYPKEAYAGAVTKRGRSEMRTEGTPLRKDSDLNALDSGAAM